MGKISRAQHLQQLAEYAWAKECEIADWLAEAPQNATIHDCAAHFGLSYPSITIYFRRMKKRIGWQAR